MPQPSRYRWWKIIVGAVWLFGFIVAYIWFERSGVSMRHLPRIIRDVVRSYGMWGPAVVILLYIVRTYFFVPTTILILVSSSLYGPLVGFVLAVIGDNLTAGFGFATGRFLGRRFVSDHETAWIKRYDEVLSRNAFLSVLFMRLFYFPFDLVNYGCGMFGVSYWRYQLATLIGLMPAIVTLVFLGDAFVNPRALIVFIFLLVATVSLGLALKSSRWSKKIFSVADEKPDVEKI